MTRVHEIAGWAVVEAIREADARRTTSLAARVQAWRQKLRAASAASGAATDTGSGASQRASRANSGDEQLGSRTTFTRRVAREEMR